MEFAFVAIPLFLFLVGSFEFARAGMSLQCMEEAARSGCRVAILKDATTAGIESEVDGMLTSAGITEYDVVITPADLSTAERLDSITVTVSAAYEDLSWLPAPVYLDGLSFSASCTFPKEASE